MGFGPGPSLPKVWCVGGTCEDGDEHHYLGSLIAAGERLHYVATDAQDQWLALVVVQRSSQSTSSSRDQWIGWLALLSAIVA